MLAAKSREAVMEKFVALMNEETDTRVLQAYALVLATDAIVRIAASVERAAVAIERIDAYGLDVRDKD